MKPVNGRALKSARKQMGVSQQNPSGTGAAADAASRTIPCGRTALPSHAIADIFERPLSRNLAAVDKWRLVGRAATNVNLSHIDPKRSDGPALTSRSIAGIRTFA